MSIYTWNGITIDPSLLPNYGFNATTSDGSGGTSARFLAYIQAGIAQVATSVTASAAGLSATSTTSATPGAGAQNLSIQTGKGFVAGQFILAYSASNPNNFMGGFISSYNSGTGALAFPVLSGDYGGTGPVTDWVVVLAGRRGLQGLTGLSYAFSTSTSGDPGPGFIRANNATIGVGVTALLVDYVDALGRDVSAALASWGASTSTLKGKIWVRLQTDLSQEAYFNLNSVTDSGGYYTLGVTYVGPVASATWTASAPLMLDFSPTGDFGAGGQNYLFDTSTTAGDPGPGNIRFSAGTLISAGFAYIDLLDKNNADITAWLATLGASSSASKGVMRVQSLASQTKFAEFTIAAAANSTGYYTLTLTYLSPAPPPTFAASEPVAITFTRTGDVGTTGAGSTVFTAVAGVSTGTARPMQNFIPVGLTIAAVDNPGSTRTDITITAPTPPFVPPLYHNNGGF